jgi:hypothetical protein
VHHAFPFTSKPQLMKKFLSFAFLSAALCTLMLQGCVKDSYKKTTTYTYYVPVYKTTAEVRANIRSNAPRQVEKPGKIYMRGSYIFLNDIDKGIHIIDNYDPADPHPVAFIDIPGCMDMAVKGNTLYADLYTDLVTLDISDPMNVVVKDFEAGVFPHRQYSSGFVPDPNLVIVSWEKKDTSFVEEGDVQKFLVQNNQIFFALAASGGSSGGGSAASVSPVGTGGSMARFTIVNDRLYTVGTNDLRSFDITQPHAPVQTSTRQLGWNIETIFPFKNKLFIGSTTGMFIFDISYPDNPQQQGQFAHVQSCDPVVADDNYAYVTLRSGTRCQGFTNELNILNVTNPASPQMVKTYNLTNPHGLAKEGSLLFICDGRDGLKIYDAYDVNQLQLLSQVPGIDAYDVIVMNGVALVVAKDGLYQYTYGSGSQVQLLSKITVNP